MTCEALRVGDQMMCGRCGQQWDHDDPDRPDCVGDRLSALAVSTRTGNVNPNSEGPPCREP